MPVRPVNFGSQLNLVGENQGDARHFQSQKQFKEVYPHSLDGLPLYNRRGVIISTAHTSARLLKSQHQYKKVSQHTDSKP